MMHCECGWAWEWANDPTPHCPFCGRVGVDGPSVPPETVEAVREVSGK